MDFGPDTGLRVHRTLVLAITDQQITARFSVQYCIFRFEVLMLVAFAVETLVARPSMWLAEVIWAALHSTEGAGIRIRTLQYL